MSLIKDIINKIKSIFKKNKVQKLDKAKEIEVVEKTLKDFFTKYIRFLYAGGIGYRQNMELSSGDQE